MSPPRPLPGSGLCGLLFLVQLDSPRQDMPGGPGRWPGSLREVWKNPGGRAPGRAPEGSSRALSATLQRRAQAHEGRGTSPGWGLSGPGARAWRCHQRLPGPERAVRSRPPQARPREAAGARGRVSPSSFILVSVNPQSSLRGCTENTQPDTWLWRAPGDRHSSPAVTAPAGCQAPGTQRRAAPVWGRGRGAPRGAGEPRVSAMESICDWHSTAPGPVSGTGAPDRRRLGGSWGRAGPSSVRTESLGGA